MSASRKGNEAMTAEPGALLSSDAPPVDSARQDDNQQQHEPLSVNIPAFDRRRATLAPISALPAVHYSPQTSPTLRSSMAMPPPPAPSAAAAASLGDNALRRTSHHEMMTRQQRSSSGSSQGGGGGGRSSSSSHQKGETIAAIRAAAAEARDARETSLLSSSDSPRLPSTLAHSASTRVKNGRSSASARRMSAVVSPQGIDEYARIIVQSRNAKMQKWRQAGQRPTSSTSSQPQGGPSVQKHLKVPTIGPAPSSSNSKVMNRDSERRNSSAIFSSSPLSNVEGPLATPNVSPTASLVDGEGDTRREDGFSGEIEWVDWLDEYRRMKEVKLRAEQENSGSFGTLAGGRSRSSTRSAMKSDIADADEQYGPIRPSSSFPSAGDSSQSPASDSLAIPTPASRKEVQASPSAMSKSFSSATDIDNASPRLPKRRPSDQPLHRRHLAVANPAQASTKDGARSWSDSLATGDERVSHFASLGRRSSTLADHSRNISLSPITSRMTSSGSQSWSTGGAPSMSAGKRKKLLSGKIEAWWGAVKTGFGSSTSPPVSAPAASHPSMRNVQRQYHNYKERDDSSVLPVIDSERHSGYEGGSTLDRVHSMFNDQTYGTAHIRSRTQNPPSEVDTFFHPLRTTSSAQNLKRKDEGGDESTESNAEMDKASGARSDHVEGRSNRSSTGTAYATPAAILSEDSNEAGMGNEEDTKSPARKGLGIDAGKESPSSAAIKLRKGPKLSLHLEHGLSAFDAGPFEKLTPSAQGSATGETTSSAKSSPATRQPALSGSPKSGLSDAWQPSIQSNEAQAARNSQHGQQQALPHQQPGSFAQLSQRRRSKLRDTIEGGGQGRKDITIDSIRQHIHHRLASSKEICDRELRKVITSINFFVEDRIQTQQLELLLQHQQENDDELDATTYAMAAVDISTKADDQAEGESIQGPDTQMSDAIEVNADGKRGTGEIMKRETSNEKYGTLSSSTAQDRRGSVETVDDTSTQTTAATSRSAAIGSDDWLNAPRSRQASIASKKEYMLPPPPQRAQAGMARSVSRGHRNRNRSREVTSTSTSRSHSPLPGSALHTSESPQYSPARRMRPLPSDESPSEPYMGSLQDLVCIAMDVLDTSIHTLTTRTGACRDIIATVQNVGKAWEENPQWPGRGWYVQLLLAVAALSRVVEWWEAERGFWNFEEEGDDLDQEPIRFIVGPQQQSGSLASAASEQRPPSEFGESLPPSALTSRNLGSSSPVRLIRNSIAALHSGANRTPSQQSSATNSPALEPVDRRGGMEESGMRSTRSSTPPIHAPVLDDAMSVSEMQQSIVQPENGGDKESQNILMELSLDGERFLYLSPAWQTVIGTDPAELFDRPIEDVLAPGDAQTFAEATQQLQIDDSHTVEAVFRLLVDPSVVHEADDDVRYYQETEGKGMLMHDRQSGLPTHTMWVIKTVAPPEAEANLGPVRALTGAGDLSMAAGAGVTVEAGDPQALLSTEPVLCRICERDIPACFFERHSEICNEIHRLEMEITENNEMLYDLRRTARAIVTQLESSKEENPDYRNIPLSTPAASTMPPSALEVANRSLSPRHPNPAAIRKAHLRALNSIIDILRIAATISTPATKDDSVPIEKQRLLSPESENKVIQVRGWKTPLLPSEDAALELLAADVDAALRRKLGAVNRMSNTIVYVETIRLEWERSLEAALAETQDEREDDEDETKEDTSSTVSMSGSEGKGNKRMEDARSHGDNGVHEQTSRLAASASIPSLKEVLLDSSHEKEGDDDDGMDADTSAVLLERYENELPPGSSTLSARDDPERDDDDIPEVDTSMGGSVMHPIPIPARSNVPPRVRQMQQQREFSAVSSSSGEMAGPSEGSLSASFLPHSRRESLMPGDRSYVQTPPLSPRHSPVDGTSIRQKDRRTSHSLRAIAPNSPLLGSSMPISPRIPPMAPSSRTTASSIKDFDIIKPISKGAFGSVFLTRKRATGDYYAIKVLKKSDMIAKNQITNVKAERMILMTQTQSPFVVKLFFTFQSAENLYLVMEYLPGGDCASLVKALGALPEDWSRQFIAEVVNGLETLHAQGVVHRDMKPDNLLIDHRGHLKLTDFGLSKIGLLGRQNQQQMASGRGSVAAQGGGLTPPWQQQQSSHQNDPRGKKDPNSAASSVPTTGSALSTSFSPSYSRTPANFAAQPFYIGTPTHPRGRIMSASTDASDSSGSEGALALGSGQHKPLSHLTLLDSPRNTFGSQPGTSSLTGKEGSGSGQHLRKFVGTPDYLAPESILGLGMDDAAVDWWALGVILYEFLYGYPPFHADTPEKVFDNILSRNISWDDEDVEISDEARDLMERLMSTDRKQRLGAHGAHEIKQHPFFAGIDWGNLMAEEGPFVPQLTDPESTDYFDLRGAVYRDLHVEETKGLGVQEFARAIEGNARMIEPSRPPTRNRLSSERHGKGTSEGPTDEFGSFSYKNLPVLKQANDEVIKKMRGDQLNSMSAAMMDQQQLTQQMGALSISQSQAMPIGNASSGMTHMRHRSISGKVVTPSAHRGSAVWMPAGPPSPTTSISSQSSVPSKSTAPTSPSGAPFLLSGQLHHHLSGSQQAHHRRRPSDLSSITGLAGSPMGSMSGASGSGSGGGTLSSVTERKRSQFIQQEEDVRRTSLPTRLRTASLSSHVGDRPALPWQLQAPPYREPPSLVAEQQPLESPSTAVSSDAGAAKVGDNTAHAAGLGLIENESPHPQQQQQQQQQRTPLSASSQSNRGSADTGQAPSTAGMEQISCLIAEDNPISLRMLEQIMAKLGCHITSVRNGAEALRLAMGETKFSVLLVDVTLPIVSGQDVARMIRSTRNANTATPIVALASFDKQGNLAPAGVSTTATTETINTLLDATGGVFDAVLAKPVEKNDLCNLLPQFGFQPLTARTGTTFFGPANAGKRSNSGNSNPQSGGGGGGSPVTGKSDFYNNARRATIAFSAGMPMASGGTTMAGGGARPD